MVARCVVLTLGLLVASVGFASEEKEFDGIPLTNWPVPGFWSPPVLASEEAVESLEKAGVPSPPLPFVAIQPCRLVDTRPSQGFPAAWGPPALIANATRDFDLDSAPHCAGIPAGVQAYSVNVTVTETQGPGDVRLWPAGNPPLNVSTQNWPAANVTLANAAIVPAGTGGAITVQVAVSGTHLIIDINGYFGGTVGEVQARVTGTCSAGSSIRIINANGTVTCETDDSGTAGWSLTGNAGTDPTTNFLGTTDNQALELRVFGVRKLRLQVDHTIIAGHVQNSVVPGADRSVISGGGGSGPDAHRVFDSYGTIAGGRGNTAGTDDGVVNQSPFATVGGGAGNDAAGWLSVISGGDRNSAVGFAATVPGGTRNHAVANAFAAGTRAVADDVGAFVWADSNEFDYQSTAVNQFNVRAVGGARFVSGIDGAGGATAGVALAAGGNAWAPLSDRAAKENFCDVDEEALLERLAAVPIETWNLKSQDPSIRHIGPMAQDFAAAFGVGEYDNRITTSDADGVAFAAIQALYRQLKAQQERIRELEVRLENLIGTREDLP